MSKSKNVNNRQFGQSAVTGVVLPDGTSDTETAGGGGGSRPVSGTEPNTPKLLTGGHPRTEVSKIPTLPLAEVPVFEHGGYDGGIEVGFDGTWMVEKFPGLIEKLEEAKNRACEIQKEPEGFKIVLAGEEVLVMATGAKVGGLLYKYRFICRGVEFLVHSNPPKNRQPVRVRYLSESLIGNNFFTVHEQFVMPFLKRLGLTVHADKPSRIDMQVMIDVPVSEFIELFKTGHGVTKLRRGASFFAVTPSGFVDDTLTLGCIKRVQVSIYDKRKEMQKMDLVKQAFFIQCCVGDEWFNSGRPITRVEVRLGRVALKCLGVNTITDLKEREHAMLDLITKDWFRILKDPKVRGHETSAAIHPVWERVRILFGSYFSGASVEDVKWEKDQSVSCDPVALEKQA